MTKKIKDRLFELQDYKIKLHNAKLIPSIPKDKIIGVTFKNIDKIAKELLYAGTSEKFLLDLPHQYFEEDILHAKLINAEKNFSTLIGKLENFLPYLDNWAVCDSLSPMVFVANRGELLLKLRTWMNVSDWHTRFCLNTLSKHYLKTEFSKEILIFALSANSGAYYVDMGLAWFLSYALIFNYEDVIDIIESRQLPRSIHKKTIQKAVDSYRVPKERKEYLKTLR